MTPSTLINHLMHLTSCWYYIYPNLVFIGMQPNCVSASDWDDYMDWYMHCIKCGEDITGIRILARTSEYALKWLAKAIAKSTAKLYRYLAYIGSGRVSTSVFQTSVPLGWRRLSFECVQKSMKSRFCLTLYRQKYCSFSLAQLCLNVRV